MRLYLVQHGEALDKRQDPDRPLSETGSTDVTLLAARLAAARIRVPRILHSGKTRAMQTAAKLAHTVLDQGEMDTSGLLEPTADPGPVVELIRGLGADSMIVGHEPFLGRLASRLLTAADDTVTFGFRPGSLLCLEGDSDTPWQVAWMLSPEILRSAPSSDAR